MQYADHIDLTYIGADLSEFPERMVEVASVLVSKSRRTFSMEAALVLADSIDREGLLQPVVINESRLLVAGLHRLIAHQILGRSLIRCLVVPDDPLLNEMAEIDENLARKPLTVLETCQCFKRLKELLLEQQAKQISLGLGNNKVKGGFTKVIAERVKRTVRLVQLKIEIATDIDPSVQISIAPTPIAESLKELRLLKKAEPEEQKELVGLVLSGEAKSIYQAWKLLHSSEPAVGSSDKGLELLKAILKALSQGPEWEESDPSATTKVIEKCSSSGELISLSLKSIFNLLNPNEERNANGKDGMGSKKPRRKGRESSSLLTQANLPGTEIP